MQVFLEHTKGAKGEELEREMFILRKVIEKAKAAKLREGLDGLSDFYIVTMSSKTIVYKVQLGLVCSQCCLPLLLLTCFVSVRECVCWQGSSVGSASMSQAFCNFAKSFSRSFENVLCLWQVLLQHARDNVAKPASH